MVATLTILNPEHLFEQAEKLAASPSAGAPRQADLRRAISAAYYGVFHYVLAAAADAFVGASKRGTGDYALVYRRVEHRMLRELCIEAQKQQMSAKYERYAPAGGFGPDIQVFASGLLELQELRHMADYDPSMRLKTVDASLAITTARSAVLRFKKARKHRHKTFLALLLFLPR